MNRNRHERLIGRSRLRGQVLSTVLGTAGLALVCCGWTTINRHPDAARCDYIADEEWLALSDELDTDATASRLGIPREQVARGMIGAVACQDSDGNARVSTDEMVTVTGIPGRLVLSSQCLTLEIGRQLPETRTMESLAFCPGEPQ